eukprot:1160911-Pelagomonas_calceolata.AAC.2
MLEAEQQRERKTLSDTTQALKRGPILALANPASLLMRIYQGLDFTAKSIIFFLTGNKAECVQQSLQRQTNQIKHDCRHASRHHTPTCPDMALQELFALYLRVLLQEGMYDCVGKRNHHTASSKKTTKAQRTSLDQLRKAHCISKSHKTPPPSNTAIRVFKQQMHEK